MGQAQETLLLLQLTLRRMEEEVADKYSPLLTLRWQMRLLTGRQTTAVTAGYILKPFSKYDQGLRVNSHI